jgi:threonine/homoserine/homoserine lactone efflux protein
MSLSQVLAFALLSVVIIAVPGPSVLFTVGRALTVGRREALLSVAGNALGTYVQAIAVAVGVGVVIERSIVVLTVIKLVGAAYLVFLGVQAIRHRRKVTEALAAGIPTVIPSRRALRDGLVVGVTNPKTIVFLVVALPQFTNPAAGNVPL